MKYCLEIKDIDEPDFKRCLSSLVDTATLLSAGFTDYKFLVSLLNHNARDLERLIEYLKQGEIE